MIPRMDEKTARLYELLREEGEGRETIPFPMVKIECSLEDVSPYWFRRLYMRGYDYRTIVNAYWDACAFYYSDCYRCLAYRVYGYGYYSNNERRMAGLKPRRVRRRR